MTQSPRFIPLAAALLGLGFAMSSVQATEGYATSSDGKVVKSGSDECWHSSDWTMDKAILGCDGVADSDNDGVFDSKDKCPDTPAGAKVDEKGCELDSDHDGVADSKDKCPGTPAGTPVDARGCPLDSDGDGVTDDIDRCPDTPAGTKVDPYGCPLDSDGDGVPDSADRCPGTPAGTRVDANGCPLMTRIELHGVNFAHNQAQVSAAAGATLDGVVANLKRHPDLKVEIAGHTDSTGTEAYNQGLSERRAAAVKAYMVERGINASRLVAKGFGESQPVASNATAEGRARNRRVELKLLDH